MQRDAAKSFENGSAIRDAKSQRRERTAREINVSPPEKLSADLLGKLKNFPVGIPNPSRSCSTKWL